MIHGYPYCQGDQRPRRPVWSTSENDHESLRKTTNRLRIAKHLYTFGQQSRYGQNKNEMYFILAYGYGYTRSTLGNDQEPERRQL